MIETNKGIFVWALHPFSCDEVSDISRLDVLEYLERMLENKGLKIVAMPKDKMWLYERHEP